MKLKELLSALLESDGCPEISIINNGHVEVEDELLYDLPFGKYIDYKNKEVKSITALGSDRFYIVLEPSP